MAMLELEDGEAAMLLRTMPPGEQHAIRYSFGIGWMGFDEEEYPEAAKKVRDYRDERNGVLVSEGGGI